MKTVKDWLKHIFKINSLDDGCLNYDKRHSSEDNKVSDSVGGWDYKFFKRYATKDEIEALEGKTKELQVGKWYKFDEKGLFCFTGSKNNGNYGFDAIGGWHNDLGSKCYIESTQQQVEEALIKEAEKRGIKNGVKIKDCNNVKITIHGSFVFDNTENKLYYGGATIFKDGQWANIIEVDKFAELKEAHENGAVIEVEIQGGWYDKISPDWNPLLNHRIKPEEKPKVGDVCKFWDDDECIFVISNVVSINNRLNFPYKTVIGISYKNAKQLAKQQVIDLLFNKK